MTKKEKAELERAKETMCDRYCKVPDIADELRETRTFEEWLDAVQIACRECPLDKIGR